MTLAVDLAATHARAMPHRPWTANAFARLLDSAGVFLIGDARCFALGRVAADEAELLTLACDPDHRRQGLARAALTAFEGTALAKDARTAFLEVAADNHAAITLYSNAGWENAGRRKGYYSTCSGQVDAIVMRRDLTPHKAGLRR
jgi:[ribosomal protein S18]-alanine N-acetyltransferase